MRIYGYATLLYIVLYCKKAWLMLPWMISWL